jgi:DNA-binding MarR family transcriptional regulator
MPDEVDAILAQWRSQRPDLDPSPMGVFGRLSRIHALSRARQTATLAAFGLNLAAFDVLANLRRSGPPFRKSPSALAASSMLTSGGVTFRLDKLEALGLIRRVPSKEDRRAIHAELTDRGLELIDEVLGAHLATEAAMLEGLTDVEAEQLVGLLRALERSVTRTQTPGAGGQAEAAEHS